MRFKICTCSLQQLGISWWCNVSGLSSTWDKGKCSCMDSICSSSESVIVSPSLDRAKHILKAWLPPREVLLGVGEPYSWDSRYDIMETDKMLVDASQQFEKSVTDSSLLVCVSPCLKLKG